MVIFNIFVIKSLEKFHNYLLYCKYNSVDCELPLIYSKNAQF